MADIIVTTPKTKHKIAAQEAEECKAAGGGYYFRHFSRKPKQLRKRDRCYYVDQDHVTGFATIEIFNYMNELVEDETTGQLYSPGFYIWMPATTWKWIAPIPMKGFQGFRYADITRNIPIIGSWQDPKPFIPTRKSIEQSPPQTLKVSN